MDGDARLIARMKRPVCDELEDAKVTGRIGDDRSHATVRAAVRAVIDGDARVGD
jgi:hypothetical protein